MFKPGEQRMRLLQWLFARIDSRLNNMIEAQYSSHEGISESRIKRILVVASTLGLCHKDDIDLIRGVASVSKQTVFMDRLLDTVCIMDSAADPHTKAMQDPRVVSDSMSLNEQFIKDCQFIDSLAEKEDVTSLFPAKSNLYPPDLVRMIEKQWKENGYKPGDKNLPLPDIKQLVKDANSVSQDLERMIEILDQLKKKFPYPTVDPQMDEKMGRTLKLLLSELSQLVTGFSYCFENEMHHWCNKSAPQLSQLGPAFKRVCGLLQIFTSVLQSLSTVRGGYVAMCGKTRDALKNMPTEKSNNLANISQATCDTFQDVINILDETIIRGSESLP
ncbi:HAUS augmin-like complex subunit 7 isoform X2 [Lineus longissimus]